MPTKNHFIFLPKKIIAFYWEEKQRIEQFNDGRKKKKEKKEEEENLQVIYNAYMYN